MPRISHYVKKTKVLGPGNRFCIWFQGCEKRCDGCINKDGQDIKGGIFIDNSILMNLLRADNSITGVTISGGEPFLQGAELLDLVRRIKEETALDIMIYTGYTFENLIVNEIYKRILGYIDILVDGEYDEVLNNNELYRGSSNQKIHFITNKYKSYEDKINRSKSRNIEFQSTGEDDLIMIGIPPKDFYEEFIKLIKKEV